MLQNDAGGRAKKLYPELDVRSRQMACWEKFLQSYKEIVLAY